MRIAALTTLGLVAVAASLAFADTVKLKNGDTLTGTVVSVLDGKLTLKTAAAGDVAIDVGQIDSFATDNPAKVEIKHANSDATDVVNSKVGMASGGNIAVETASGPQTVALSSVGSVNKPATPEAWSGSIVGSSTWTRGNTYTQSTAVDINAVRRGAIDRITFAGWYRSARQKDASTGVTSTSQRRAGGSLKYDYFFSKKAYGYALVLGEKDAIAAIDLRFSAGIGAGWQFIEEDNAHFNAEAGMSYFSENYSNGTPTTDDAAARVAYHYDRKVCPKSDVLFFNDTDAYKIFGDAHDYLVHTKAGLRENLTASFFAQEWVEFYWDPTPATGKRRQDVTYFLGIGWSF